jgi:hypothetical protein
MLLRRWGSLPLALALPLWLAGAQARAHPFVDLSPLPPTTVASGSTYALALLIFPGDTPVTRVQLDFELSSPLAFGVLPPEMGEGFLFVRDPVADPLHFSIEADFSAAPLEAFGAFPVAQLAFVAAEPDAELQLQDTSYIEALELGNPVVFDQFISNAPPDGVVAHVVPEPAAVTSLAAALGLLAALGRARRR